MSNFLPLGVTAFTSKHNITIHATTPVCMATRKPSFFGGGGVSKCKFFFSFHKIKEVFSFSFLSASLILPMPVLLSVVCNIRAQLRQSCANLWRRVVAAVWLLPPCLPVHRADPGDMIIAMEIQSSQSPGSLAILSAATQHHQPSLTHAPHTHTHTDNEPFDSDRRCVNLTCSSLTTETQNSFR